MELSRIKSFISRKLRPSQADHHPLQRRHHKAVLIAPRNSYSVKPFGLHLKAFFLCLLGNRAKFQEANIAVNPAMAFRPLSESGGAQLPLLLLIVAAFLSLPLFFNLNSAVASSKSAVPLEATRYSSAKEVVRVIKDDNTTPPHRPANRRSLASVPEISPVISPGIQRPATIRPLLKPTPPDFKRGSTALKEVSFTFDGGSHRGQTQQILHILRQRRIKTTIFLTGQFIEKNPRLVRRMLKDGHEIGNHLMNHPHMTTYSSNGRHRRLPHVDKAFLLRQLYQTADIFTRTTGEKMAPIWRAPYGEVNNEIRGWAYNAGYMHVGWTTDYKRKESMDSLDWVSDPNSRLYRTTAQIKERILGFGKGRHGLSGGVVLMHLGTFRRGEKLASRLGEMIDELHARGYRFVKVSALIKGRKDMAAYLTGADRIEVAKTNMDQSKDRLKTEKAN